MKNKKTYYELSEFQKDMYHILKGDIEAQKKPNRAVYLYWKLKNPNKMDEAFIQDFISQKIKYESLSRVHRNLRDWFPEFEHDPKNKQRRAESFKREVKQLKDPRQGEFWR